METRSAKRKKLMITALDKAHRYRGEDRISELSDDILHHILSLLPTKTIVRMSILSKRWRFIWSSFPDLDFSSMPVFVAHNKTRNIMDNRVDFVSRVLFSNNKGSDIRALRFSADLSFTRLNHLIKQAVRRNVQELDLDIITNDCFNLTRSVVTCKSLRVLKIKSYSGFRLPPATTVKDGFQALHTLSLSLIAFDGQSSLFDFFSETSFPLLKKLDLVHCMGLKSLRIACRGIVDITLGGCIELIDLIISCCKLERLTVRDCFAGDSGWVEIDAPLLKIFVWETNEFVKSSFVQKSICLEEASISYWLRDSNDLSVSKISTIANLICGTSSSRSITLDSLCFQMLAMKDNTTSLLPHSFANLERLELEISFDKKKITTLALLLRISPSLQTLIINIDSHSKIEMKEWDKEWCNRFISEEEVYCEQKIQGFVTFVHTVKVVKINAYNQYAFVFCLAKFLNKYGIFLQEMTLPLKLKSQFNGFPWASSIAKIDYVK